MSNTAQINLVAAAEPPIKGLTKTILLKVAAQEKKSVRVEILDKSKEAKMTLLLSDEPSSNYMRFSTIVGGTVGDLIWLNDLCLERESKRIDVEISESQSALFSTESTDSSGKNGYVRMILDNCKVITIE